MLSKKELISKDFLKIINKVHNKVHYVYNIKSCYFALGASVVIKQNAIKIKN